MNQYYLRARYYNPGVGRFTQMDSWQGIATNPTTLNKYLYADANPIMNIDPTGNFSLGGMMSGLNGFAQLSTMSYRAISIGWTVLGTATRPLMNASAGSHATSAALAGLVYATVVNHCRNNEDCKPPISMIVYGNTHYELANHIFDAQTGSGSNSSPTPAILSRYKKGHSRGWLDSRKKNGNICDYKSKGMGPSDCDEYPFASSYEGGSLNYESGKVSLRPIDSFHNQDGGRLLGQMYGGGVVAQ